MSFCLFDRHCEQSEAIQTKPQLETPSLGRFALLAMTESAVDKRTEATAALAWRRDTIR